MQVLHVAWASFSELEAGFALAERLTGQATATPASILRIDDLTGMAGWVTGGPVDGVFITVPLSADGLAAVRHGSFAPALPSLAHICCKAEACGGVFIGVYAGATKESRRRARRQL